MTETTQRPKRPDHLSTDERSPHFVKAILEQDVGIRFNAHPHEPNRRH